MSPHSLGKSQLALGLALWACTVSTAAHATVSTLRQSVSYIEFQDRPGAPTTGRSLPRDQGPQGLDADSSLQININRRSVTEALLPASAPNAAQLQNLRDRITQLTPLVETVNSLAVQSTQASMAYLSRRISGADYESLVDQQSQSLLSSFQGLERAISLRRQDEGVARPAADKEADTHINALLLAAPPGEYNTAALVQNIDVELRALNRRVEELLDASSGRVGVEVRAHLVRQDGSAVAVRLSGYNEEALGASTRFRRIQTELSQEERDAYAEYEKLAQKLQNAKNAGEALRTSFEQLFPALSREASQTLQEIAGEVQALRASLDALADALEREKFEPWLRSLPGTFPSELKDDIDALDKELQGLRQELDELERLRSNLASQLPSMTPLQAHDEVARLVRAGSGLLSVSRWQTRQAAVEKFFQTFERQKPQVAAALLKTGPLKAAVDARDQLFKLLDAMKRAGERLQKLRKDLGVVAPAVAATWPEPVSQKRRSGAMDLDTSVDLKTIAGGRVEGDTLVVSHRFYVDDTLTDEWEDRFVIQAYGWRGWALAGLAFSASTSGGLSAWKPSATVGWYVTYRSWPSTSQGLGSSKIDYIGIGVSAVSLDFDATKDIELGVAGGLSLFNNFAQVGYGANLSVDKDRGFFFFSIRPLQLGELLGSPGGK